MDYGNFDTDAFISDIKIHECIWNYRSELYSDRIGKNNAWVAICGKYVENFHEKTTSDKNKIAKSLQNKWKVIRDGYNRYMRKIKNVKSGPAASRSRQYVFFNQLSFLRPLAEEKANTVDSLTRDYTNEDTVDVEESVSQLHSSSRKRKTTAVKEDILMEKLSRHIDMKLSHPYMPSGTAEYDDDKLFLLALHGDFKKISDEYKLDAKTEILNIIKRFKTMSSQPYRFSHHMNQNYYDGYNRTYFTEPTTSTNISHSIPIITPTKISQSIKVPSPISVISDETDSSIFSDIFAENNEIN